MLWGRAADLAVLSHHIARCVPVLVAGATGVGKTALIRAAAAATPRRVLSGGGLSTLSSVAYLPLIRALERKLDGDPAAVATEVRRRVGTGLLILDDLQWADDATLATLPLLAGAIHLVAAARRGDPDYDRAVAAARDAGFEILELDRSPPNRLLVREVATPVAESRRSSRRRVLTLREQEVLRLVRRGLTSAAVADQLGLSAATVDSHIQSAMSKLGARSRVQAALLAERE